MAKRARKPNFSSAERVALIEEFSLRKSALQQKFRTNSANKDKQKAWFEICEAVNSVSTCGRSVVEVKEKWSKLSSEARVQLRARKYPPTGSGKVDEMPDLDLFEPIFGDSDLIEGIGEDVGGFDSGDPAPNQASDRSRSPSQEPIQGWQIVTDECGILRVADSTPSRARNSTPSGRRPESAPTVPEDSDTSCSSGTIPPERTVPTSSSTDGVSAFQRPPQHSDPTTSSSAAASAFASTSGEPFKRTPLRRAVPVPENQSELYCKYLAISTELKELMKQQLQDGLCDNELKKMLTEKAMLDIQCSQANLQRVLCGMKQDAEIHDLQKEKLKLEIQSLKAKGSDAN